MNDDQKLQSGDDLAMAALEEAEATPVLGAGKTPAQLSDGDDEAAASDQLAQTLTSLQNVIERNAQQLEEISNDLKNKREMLKNIFENDTTLAEAEVQVKAFSDQIKQRRSQLQADPQATTLKVQIGELNEQKKEVEEALSNYLVNYHQITGSKSFDTSEGDQWEFDIKAKVKARKK
jgi:chromosome segregation ATPase